MNTISPSTLPLDYTQNEDVCVAVAEVTGVDYENDLLTLSFGTDDIAETTYENVPFAMHTGDGYKRYILDGETPPAGDEVFRGCSWVFVFAGATQVQKWDTSTHSFGTYMNIPNDHGNHVAIAYRVVEETTIEILYAFDVVTSITDGILDELYGSFSDLTTMRRMFHPHILIRYKESSSATMYYMLYDVVNEACSVIYHYSGGTYTLVDTSMMTSLADCDDVFQMGFGANIGIPSTGFHAKGVVQNDFDITYTTAANTPAGDQYNCAAGSDPSWEGSSFCRPELTNCKSREGSWTGLYCGASPYAGTSSSATYEFDMYNGGLGVNYIETFRLYAPSAFSGALGAPTTAQTNMGLMYLDDGVDQIELSGRHYLRDYAQTYTSATYRKEEDIEIGFDGFDPVTVSGVYAGTPPSSATGTTVALTNLPVEFINSYNDGDYFKYFKVTAKRALAVKSITAQPANTTVTTYHQLLESTYLDIVATTTEQLPLNHCQWLSDALDKLGENLLQGNSDPVITAQVVYLPADLREGVPN